MTASEMIEQFVRGRVYIFDSSRVTAYEAMVYESCWDEGDGVKKKLFQGTREEAEFFLDLYRKAWTAYIRKAFRIRKVKTIAMPPTVQQIRNQMGRKQHATPTSEKGHEPF